jgi:hypothetical protein
MVRKRGFNFENNINELGDGDKISINGKKAPKRTHTCSAAA